MHTVRSLHSTAQLLLTRLQGTIAKATTTDVSMADALSTDQPMSAQVSFLATKQLLETVPCACPPLNWPGSECFGGATPLAWPVTSQFSSKLDCAAKLDGNTSSELS